MSLVRKPLALTGHRNLPCFTHRNLVLISLPQFPKGTRHRFGEGVRFSIPKQWQKVVIEIEHNGQKP